MKSFWVICSLIFLVALSACDDTPTRGSDTSGWNIICVEGHQYIYRPGYDAMAPKFNADDKPAKCSAAERWSTDISK